MACWRVLVKCMMELDMTRSTADPCLYFKWTEKGLVMIISWINDMLIISKETVALQTKKEFMTRFDCDDCGEIKEYVGCKVEWNGSELKFTQLVLLQSFVNEFQLPTKAFGMPAAGGTMLKKPVDVNVLTGVELTKY